MTTVINDWAKILDNREQVDTFILDFEKAFDTPPHERLKSKLFSYGIGGKTLKWIDLFLCVRQQRVVVNGVKSDWAPVLSGVPQGTVLGPLLFSLYINDISSDTESEIRLFADDYVCYREIKDEEDTMKLQSDIDRLGSWARKWGMRFQPVKCNMMQLTRKRIKKIHASYTLEGTDLENVESIKYLGVTITSNLRWNTHVSNVCTKANRTLGFLRRNLYSCPEEVKEAAYKGLVRPVLDYGSSVWDPPGVVLQEELESVQKRAARFVTGNYNYETGRMTGFFVQLKWESLKKMRKDNRLILLYKGLKGKASVPTDDLITKTRRCRNQHSMAFQTPDFRFGTKLYRQIVGIPMGTNCAPLVADLFLFCYERDFMTSLSDVKQAEIIEAFKSTSRYLDDLLNIDNPYFEGMVNRIYPPELQLNKANTSDTEAPFLDLHLSISNGFVSSKIYDKRDDFDFDIVNFPFLDGDVPRSTSYGVYISQLIRFARVSSHVVDFNARNKSLTAKLLQQGYRYHKLRKAFSKFYRRHYELVSKFNVGLKTLSHQGLWEPEFYGDLVYKFKKNCR